jgi:hypothetical protein
MSAVFSLLSSPALAQRRAGYAWGSPDLGDDFRAPVKSNVLALFISGTLDARTPVSNAEEYRAA